VSYSHTANFEYTLTLSSCPSAISIKPPVPPLLIIPILVPHCQTVGLPLRPHLAHLRYFHNRTPHLRSITTFTESHRDYNSPVKLPSNHTSSDHKLITIISLFQLPAREVERASVGRSLESVPRTQLFRMLETTRPGQPLETGTRWAFYLHAVCRT